MPDIMIAVGEGDDISYVPLTEYEDIESVLTELPEDVVHQHPEFNRVNNINGTLLDEVKAFKKRAQTAEQQLKQGNTPSGEGDDPTPPQAEPIDLEALQNQILNDVLETINTRQTAEQERRTGLQNLVDKHGLAGFDGIMDILADSSNPEKTAERLGVSSKKFDTVSGGEPDVTSEDYLEGLFTNVYGNLNLPKDS